ncbi:Peptidase C39 family protein [Rubripirellula amarantea]|uniref:Peptidase C39 family protein n=1 Tax=Rubripirellula amarantea TaxID=2527999 RepID=A0A5C5WFR2_9BACT|nr:hypothetical protein [Rubripirellula amarantea]TWT49594.1 Peptidase C39 family protein [Rubripirellula amarantea]
MTTPFDAREHLLELEIQPQPSETSCGPTCLAAVYEYWNATVSLDQLIRDVGELGTGGTLAVNLGCDALKRDFDVVIVTYNLQIFDPTWFDENGEMFSADFLAERLQLQLEAKRNQIGIDQARLQAATDAYLLFLSLGGRVQMQPLEESLIVDLLAARVPILCGLSATYLYQESRQRAAIVDGIHRSIDDDVIGDPMGHFVVLHGYDPAKQVVLIADPLHPNPMAPTNKYPAMLSRVTSAILLGIVTYDANLMTIRPREPIPT